MIGAQRCRNNNIAWCVAGHGPKIITETGFGASGAVEGAAVDELFGKAGGGAAGFRPGRTNSSGSSHLRQRPGGGHEPRGREAQSEASTGHKTPAPAPRAAGAWPCVQPVFQVALDPAAEIGCAGNPGRQAVAGLQAKR
jgi:hypothetical protein